MDEFGNEPMSDEEKQIREEMYAEVFDDETPSSVVAAKDEDLAVDPLVAVDPEPEKKIEVDPWAGVDPAVRDKIEGISGRMDSLNAMEERLKQTERRIGSMQNEFTAAQKAAAETPGAKAPTDEEMSNAAIDEGAWDELKDEYPVWAAAIESKLASSRPDVSGLRDSVQGIKKDMLTSAALEARLVNFVHPGWNDTVKGQDYQDWLKGQPQDVQKRHYEGETADDAVYVLDRFKEFQSSKTSPEDIMLARKNRLKQAIVIPSSKSVKPPKAEIDMTEQEIREIEAKKIWG